MTTDTKKNFEERNLTIVIILSVLVIIGIFLGLYFAHKEYYYFIFMTISLIVISCMIYVIYICSQILETSFLTLFLISVLTGGLGFFVIVAMVMNKSSTEIKIKKKEETEKKEKEKEKEKVILQQKVIRQKQIEQRKKELEQRKQQIARQQQRSRTPAPGPGVRQ